MKTLLILSIFLFLESLTHAQEFQRMEDASKCKSAISSKQKNMKSLSASFKETTYSEMLEKPQLANGVIYYKAAQKIRWEHFEPKQQIVLINASTVRLSENGQEITNPSSRAMVKRIQGLMMDLFSGNFMSNKQFKIEYLENANSYKLVLVPVNERMRRYVAQIVLTFDKKELLLRELGIHESDAEKVVYSFHSIQQDISITDTKFTQF